MTVEHSSNHTSLRRETRRVPSGRLGRLFGLIAQQARQDGQRSTAGPADLPAADACRLRAQALASLGVLPPDRDLARRMRIASVSAR